MQKIILSIFLLFISAFWSLGAHAFDMAEGIPIQHHGRIKPFSAFSQETLQLITGKNRWHGQSATSFILSNLDQPENFLTLPLIRLDHPGLRQMLDLPAEGTHVSYAQLKPSSHKLMALLDMASQERRKDNRPSALHQQAEILYQRIEAIEFLRSGEIITVIPVGQGAWESPFVNTIEASVTFKKLVHAVATKAADQDQLIEIWINQKLPIIGKDLENRLKMETLYYQAQPFYYAWLFYLFGFVCLILAKPFVVRFGKTLIIAGFFFHTAGLLLRWLILSRPPVANMFETMIFMDWVLMVTVGIYCVIKKRMAFLSSGALVSALIMLYARLLPVDQSLDVLVPVLRSSYWLTIHVITIVSSYSLFAFAMAVAHRHLYMSWRGKLSIQEDAISADTIYRLLQAGIIALGAGTILGGVWANEAWGRFWGWDPKETWAFITFLGYMAILHLRHSERLSNFALAVSSILGFLLVMMTWYGVNFVLGRGMHSYGAGSGGLTWIIVFLFFEVCFLGFIYFNRSRKT